MDNKDIFLKLDKMAGDIADLRVDSAKSVVILDRNTLDIQKHIQRTDKLETLVNKWKGVFWAVGVASSILGVLFSTLVQIFVKLYIR